MGKMRLIIMLLFIFIFLIGLRIFLYKKATLPREADRIYTNDKVDFQLLSSSIGKSQGESGYNPNADFDGDNSITILDFQILSNNFAK